MSLASMPPYFARHLYSMVPRMTGRRMSLQKVLRMLERAETLAGRRRL
ncbi:hypothetical protein AQS8620_03187 [Aquimixticola soesokkakensis]|uniref:Uncharacterized protein n=1 Tax=Aquimixticola soesokkakensis TaxID=1519096 RepID=A0A1Y5TTD5_9RHOB|nr:hypothetical protein AQS8620_03187 [Aquimixticola soesokkakensis]